MKPIRKVITYIGVCIIVFISRIHDYNMAGGLVIFRQIMFVNNNYADVAT